MKPVTIRLYIPEYPERWPYKLLPENLAQIISIDNYSTKQLTAQRVKRLLCVTFKKNIFSFFLTKQNDGWITHVDINSKRYLVHISKDDVVNHDEQ